MISWRRFFSPQNASQRIESSVLFFYRERTEAEAREKESDSEISNVICETVKNDVPKMYAGLAQNYYAKMTDRWGSARFLLIRLI